MAPVTAPGSLDYQQASPEVDIKLKRKRSENLSEDSSPWMEPLLVENHEQGVEEAGGDHHQRHRPAEQCEHGQFSVSVVNILLITLTVS